MSNEQATLPSGWKHLYVGPYVLHSGCLRLLAPVGSPYVVTLVKYINDNAISYCTLLDHIPHNRAYESTHHDDQDRPGCSKTGVDTGVNADPSLDLTGGCGSDYFVTVDIPNVVCTNCALVLTNPTGVGQNSTCTHKFNPTEANGEEDVGGDLLPCATAEHKVFASCSQIEIRPSSTKSGAAGANTELTDQLCHRCKADDVSVVRAVVGRACVCAHTWCRFRKHMLNIAERGTNPPPHTHTPYHTVTGKLCWTALAVFTDARVHQARVRQGAAGVHGLGLAEPPCFPQECLTQVRRTKYTATGTHGRGGRQTLGTGTQVRGTPYPAWGRDA